MPVDEKVKNDVQGALKALNAIWDSENGRGGKGFNLTDMLGNSAQALTFSQRAFFHPGMLALLYFPAEHKYAVYTPLFASAVIPLIAAAIRELLVWKRRNAAANRRQ